MNYFKRLIVKWGKNIEANAEKAKKAKLAIEELKRKESHEKWERERKYISELRSQIFDWYNEFAKGFNIVEYYYSRTDRMLDFGVDDIVVLNHYGLRFDGSNSWDGGTNALINRGGSEYNKNPKPITCEITKIYVDTAYSFELIDKFFEQYSYDELKSLDISIVDLYKIWLEKRNKRLGGGSTNTIFDIYGLYVTVKFNVIDYDFQPKWGLNIFSFLNINSEEGTQTQDTWQLIYETNINIDMLREKEQELRQSVANAKKKVLNLFND